MVCGIGNDLKKVIIKIERVAMAVVIWLLSNIMVVSDCDLIKIVEKKM